MVETTTITVSDPVWRHLDALKDRGESFDAVLRRELDVDVEVEAEA